ncbi:hypothetical protein GOV03_03660 [Candidatus Woesearchaeota archaeon]|nr:hypothetical protein [Candidatus Woesearchaeota archaeon]
MGLFSRKKKELEVPAPPSDDILKFPKASQVKVIKPMKELTPPEREELTPMPEVPKRESEEEELPIHEKIKAAVGLKKPSLPVPTPPFAKMDAGPMLPEIPSQPEPSFHPHKKTVFMVKKPFYLRMQHYQEIFDNLGNVRAKTIEMDKNIQELEKSEFNEHKHYERLKNSLKQIHDRLLAIDDTIFKK